ncbi:hypothetical protein MBLNU230_g0822t1 [Neophaeotheca triangularis]
MSFLRPQTQQRWLQPLTQRAIHRQSPGQRRSISTRFFQVSEEVQQALSERKPVVALESTIYTHGFPYPDNLALASRLESLVRVNGGVPATIGVLDGIVRVGLGADELMRLVSGAGDTNMLKLSRRDLGFALGLRDKEGRRYNGGTTVSATSLLAHQAGISIFATGGLGGVHRGVEQTMDVSADLTELGRTPITVISSGCKSFLDIPKTLEYLETQGVAVATFRDGRGSDVVDFPAFWSRDSGVASPKALLDEVEAARVIHSHNALGLQSGLLFANPIPEEHSIPHQEMEAAIYQAINLATSHGATGAASTPYILSKIKELTGNHSVESNRALVESNVVRGTKVAKALREVEAEPAAETPSVHTVVRPTGVKGVEKPDPVVKGTRKKEAMRPRKVSAQVFVAGSLAMDLSCDYTGHAENKAPQLNTSNPAAISQSIGGVGYNVAHAAHLMGANVQLCSAVGDDLAGKAVLEALSARNMSCAGIETLGADSQNSTAQYIAVNDRNKDLVLAMADMGILEQETAIASTFENFWEPQLQQAQPTHLVLDGNWPPSHLARWIASAQTSNTHITFEPVSAPKSTNLFHASSLSLPVFPHHTIHLATPNPYELSAMYHSAREHGYFDRADWWQTIDALGIPSTGARTKLALATSSRLVDQGVPQQAIQLLPFIPSLATKLGPEGVLLTQILPADDARLSSPEYAPYILSRRDENVESPVGGVYMRLFPAVEQVPEAEVVSVNGVGDTFAGTLVAGLAKRKAQGREARVEELVDLAQRAALLTLKSRESVSPAVGDLVELL